MRALFSRGFRTLKRLFCVSANLMQPIMDKHHPNLPQRKGISSRMRSRANLLPLERLTRWHFLRRIEVTNAIYEKVTHRTILG